LAHCPCCGCKFDVNTSEIKQKPTKDVYVNASPLPSATITTNVPSIQPEPVIISKDKSPPTPLPRDHPPKQTDNNISQPPPPLPQRDIVPPVPQRDIIPSVPQNAGPPKFSHQENDEQRSNFLTQVAFGIKLKSAQDRVLAPSPEKSWTVPFDFEKIMTVRRAAFEDSDEEDEEDGSGTNWDDDETVPDISPPW